MKKILLAIIALISCVSFNAQNVVLYKGTTKVTEYTSDQVDNVTFGFEGSTQNVELYKGTTKVAEYPADQVDRTRFRIPNDKGTAKATINNVETDVPWVQLWENGPKWAVYNVGVTDGKPESYGGHYVWGSTTTESPSSSTADIQYGEDDTARNLWGDNWQMPRKDQFAMLLDKNYTDGGTWISDYNSTGVNGYLVKGKAGTIYENNQLFLPSPSAEESFGYWASTLFKYGNKYTPYFLYVSYDNDFQTILLADGQASFTNYVRAILKEADVSEVSLDKNSVIIEGLNSITLTATVLPYNATDKRIYWTSSNNAVATVNNGVVKATGVGTATITATTVDGGYTANCEVTVLSKAVAGISLNQNTASLIEELSLKLTATVLPTDATDRRVNWVSSDESVAKVNDGVVTRTGDGTVTITATTVEGGFAAECVINIHLGVTGTAKATINSTETDVPWVKLWKDGPKWAAYNVGVTDGKPESYGDYYTWGTTTKLTSPSTSTVDIQYGTDDTAKNLWGGNWQMPTQEDFAKLLDKNYTDGGTWISDYNGTGVNGYLVKGKAGTVYENNQIFLPAAGMYYENSTTLQVKNSYCCYWSSTPNDNSNAWGLSFNSTHPFSKLMSTDRGRSYSVRTILKKSDVTGISLNTSAASIVGLNSITLSATVLPENAVNKTVEWSSSNEDVATVTDGVVTGTGEGTATITARAVGDLTAQCVITILKKDVTGVSLNENTGSLIESKSLTLSATVFPQDATDRRIIWTSSNEEVATVVDGVVTRTGAGTTTITATTVDGNYSAQCVITVIKKTIAGTNKADINSTITYVPWVQLWIGGPKWAAYNVGVTDGKPESSGGYFVWGKTKKQVSPSTSTVDIQYRPDDTAKNLWGANWQMPTKDDFEKLLDKNYTDGGTWVSDYNGTGVAGYLVSGKARTIYEDNMIFLPAAGYYNPSGGLQSYNNYLNYWSSTPEDNTAAWSLFFVASSSNKLKASSSTGSYSVRAILKETSITGVSLDRTTAIIEGLNTITLTATVSPQDAIVDVVEWSSSDETVATVNGGVVTATGVGTATITARTIGDFTATCEVTVKEKHVTGVNLNESSSLLMETRSLTLNATVLPLAATDKRVTWTSSDEAVVTVTNGVVTGISEGTATITATTVDGGKTAQCTITVYSKNIGKGTTQNSEGTDVPWIQLWEDGTKWAVYNVGVTDGKPESYGNHYTWGTTDIQSSDDYDTAGKLWGNNWQMPRKEDFEQLLNTNYTDGGTWISDYNGTGVAGYLVSGKAGTVYENNTIFLPAAGYFSEEVFSGNNYVCYWASTPYIVNNQNTPYAWSLFFSRSYNYDTKTEETHHSDHLSVRAILKE